MILRALPMVANGSRQPIAVSSRHCSETPGAGDALADAVRRYEELQDLLGRIMSYAGLIYTGNTTDPLRAKFFGDAQEKVTAFSSDLPVLSTRTEPAGRNAAACCDGSAAARSLASLARGHSQGQAFRACGRSRTAVSREVGHRARGLESPVRRDDRGAAL